MNIIFDIRKSTTEQLLQLLGQNNLSAFDVEFLESDEPDSLINLLNNLIELAKNELTNISINFEDGSNSIIIKSESKGIQIECENMEDYVLSNNVLYDLNLLLEKNGCTKRLFYYWDYYDFGQDNGYFYAERELGIDLINFLKNPPNIAPEEFDDRTCNRIIDITLKDSSGNYEVKYFKQLIENF